MTTRTELLINKQRYVQDYWEWGGSTQLYGLACLAKDSFSRLRFECIMLCRSGFTAENLGVGRNTPLTFFQTSA